MFEAVHSVRRRSLPLSLFVRPLSWIIRTRSNSMCHFHCLAANSLIFFSNNSAFLQFAKSLLTSRSSTVRGVMFACRVTSLLTSNSGYLSNTFTQLFIDWWTLIFFEHFSENRVILLQTVVKWRCIKLCAIFFLDHPLVHNPLYVTKVFLAETADKSDKSHFEMSNASSDSEDSSEESSSLCSCSTYTRFINTQ